MDAGADANTCTVIVVAVLERIGIAVLCTGSPERGYVWSVAWSSSAQVNVRELVCTLTASPPLMTFPLWILLATERVNLKGS